MRRRTLLIAAAAGAAAAAPPALTACSPSRFTKKPSHPAPTPPPAVDALPSAFDDKAVWPGVWTRKTLTAARDRYLCGATVAHEAEKAFTRGWCPVVVDVSGPTTRAVLLGEDGAWTTQEVEPVAHRDENDRTAAASTIALGPALIDAEHAYLVVGAFPPSSTDPAGSAGTEVIQAGTTCPVTALKVRLADGAVAASATVSERFLARSVARIHLSFSADRDALLMAGNNLAGNDSVDADYIGLRLSAEDLSVQLDAHSVLDIRPPANVFSHGQAISAGRTTVFLADGAQEDNRNHPVLVRDGWYYHKETLSPVGSGSIITRGCARNLASGETVVLDDGAIEDVRLLGWPSVASDQQEIIRLLERESMDPFTVRRPGAPSPVLTWTKEERTLPQGAGVLGDVLYTTYYLDDSTRSGSHRLELTSLGTGETIAETDERTGMSGVNVVTPWGSPSITASSPPPPGSAPERPPLFFRRGL